MPRYCCFGTGSGSRPTPLAFELPARRLHGGAGVILGLVLLCTAPLVQSLARRALGLLPKTEKWQARRESWQTQLDTLSEESRHLLTENPAA